MALDLAAWDGGAPVSLPVSDKYPPIDSMAGAPDLRRMSECTLEGGELAYESGDGVVVTLSAEGTVNADGSLDAEKLRMEIRYEVEAILAHRGSGGSLEYRVKWAKWKESTWEPAENLAGATEALKVYYDNKQSAKQKKKQEKEGGE